MRSILRLFLPFLFVTVACGTTTKLPAAPSALAEMPAAGLRATAGAASVAVPFTLGSVAPSLGNEINAKFLAAMIQGVSASAGTSLNKIMRDAVEAVIGVKVEAQSGITQRCSLGGSVTVRHSGSTSGGTATLSNTEVVFSSCAFAWNDRIVTFHATLRASGTFRVSRPADPIHLEGEIRVDELGGPFVLNGDTGTYLNGTIVPAPGATGGTPGETIHIGPPESSLTPPAPGTPPSTGTPPPSGTPTVPPVAPGTPAPAANVTGTWGIDGQPALSLVQNGGAVTGQFLWPDIAVPGVPIEVLSNGLSGFVGAKILVYGGGVKLRAGDSQGSITAEILSTAQFDVVNGTMSGGGITDTKFTCTGFMKDFCPESTHGESNVTLTRIGATQTGTYDLSGLWAGAELIQLHQDGGGDLSGSVINGDIAEQAVSGRNDSNRVTLHVRYTTRENTGNVDYTRTIDRAYELDAYEPSSIGGFLTTVTIERCTEKSAAAAGFCTDRNKTERTASNAMLMRR